MRDHFFTLSEIFASVSALTSIVALVMVVIREILYRKIMRSSLALDQKIKEHLEIGAKFREAYIEAWSDVSPNRCMGCAVNRALKKLYPELPPPSPHPCVENKGEFTH